MTYLYSIIKLCDQYLPAYMHTESVI